MARKKSEKKGYHYSELRLNVGLFWTVWDLPLLATNIANFLNFWGETVWLVPSSWANTEMRYSSSNHRNSVSNLGFTPSLVWISFKASSKGLINPAFFRSFVWSSLALLDLVLTDYMMPIGWLSTTAIDFAFTCFWRINQAIKSSSLLLNKQLLVQPRKPTSNHILNARNFHLRSATSLPS